jgi:hypothetical protein
MASDIYTGLWTNHDSGKLYGNTLTLTARDAAFLTAAIGAFVIIVGDRFWLLLSFILWQLQATRRPVDALHRQQQVIFRNSSTAAGAFYEFILLPLPWIRSRKRSASAPVVLARSWVWALLALSSFAAWSVAGVYSSEVTKAAGTEVLVKGDKCGFLRFVSAADTDDAVQDYTFKIHNDTITAAEYARTCYMNTDKFPQCNRFVQRQLNWTTNLNASSPFAPGLAWYSDTAALQLDTGLLDSHKDIGINAPPAERVSYRKRTTCAVLRPEYIQKHSLLGISNTTNGPKYEYYLGPIGDVINATFEYYPIVSGLTFGYYLE